jgi:hypothetical protein
MFIKISVLICIGKQAGQFDSDDKDSDEKD